MTKSYAFDLNDTSPDKTNGKVTYGFVNISYTPDDNYGTQATIDSKTALPDEVNPKANPESVWQKINGKLVDQKGNLISIFSAFCVSLGGIFYKKAQSMSGSDNSLFRYILQLIIMVAILKYKKIPIFGPKDQRKLLLLRALFGIFAVVSTNFGIKYIDPSDNIALSHTNVIITAIFARFILKEKFGLSHLLSMIVTLVGVVLICRPTFIFPKSHYSNHTMTNKTMVCRLNENDSDQSDLTTLNRIIGVAFAMVGAFGSAGIHIIIRKLCVNKVHFAVNTFYGTFLGLPACVFISLGLILGGTYHKDFKCELKYLPYDFLYGIVGGFLAVVAHVTLNISLQYEDATKVSIIRSIDVLFSFLLQYFILNISTDYIGILGAFSILLGTIILLCYKFVKNRIKKNKSTKSMTDD